MKKKTAMLVWLAPLLIISVILVQILVINPRSKALVAYNTDGWLSAKIVSLELDPESKFGRTYRVVLKLRYEYEVNGKKYIGTRYNPSGKLLLFKNWDLTAMKFAEEIRTIKSIWYNPLNPSESVLVKDDQKGV